MTVIMHVQTGQIENKKTLYIDNYVSLFSR